MSSALSPKKVEVTVLRSRVRRICNSTTRLRRVLPAYLVYCIVIFMLKDPILGGLTSVWHFVFPHAQPTHAESHGHLKLVQVLFRHGHRSPFKMYPNDPNPRSLWNEGLGQLTKLGRLQHYALGDYIRKRYSSYLTFNPEEVNCMSSSAERCLYGAYALLAALYPAPPNKRISENLQWQPVPVKYTPESRDRYLQSTANCPVSDREKKSMFRRAEGLAFIQQYKELYEFWSNKSGLNIQHYDNAGSLYKTLCVQKTLNLVIPEWAEETWADLMHQGDMCYYFHFRTKLLHRLRAGPLIGLMLDKMRNKITNPKHRRRMYLYSGHGSNLAAVLQALHLFNKKIPPYVAALIFEMYEQRNPLRHSLRILFSNTSSPEVDLPEPRPLILPGCIEYCPLEYFEEVTRDLIPLDWRAECQIKRRWKRKIRNN